MAKMKAGKIVVLAPQKPAEFVEHTGKVVLEDLYRILGCRTVDCVGLGKLPSGRSVDMWVDDEGLLNDAVPNRQFPGGQVLAGTILICTSGSDGDSMPLTDAEAQVVMSKVQGWRLLGENDAKPEPEMRVTTWPGEGGSH